MPELGMYVDCGGEETVWVDAVHVEESGGTDLSDVALDRRGGDLKQDFGALYRLGGHRHREPVLQEIGGQPSEEIYNRIVITTVLPIPLCDRLCVFVF